MATTSNYLALDLGAESGRGLLGHFDGQRLATGRDSPLSRMVQSRCWIPSTGTYLGSLTRSRQHCGKGSIAQR